MKPAPTDPPEINRMLWDDIAAGYMGYDIGANCGQTLPEMTARFSHVIAFEPAEECQPWLLAWVAGSNEQRGTVEAMPVAISDHDGEVSLVALPDKINTGQLVTAGTHGMEWSADVPEAVARTITCRTVDSLVFNDSLARPDFCKIDVEGHEDKVLRGALRTIAMYRPQLLIEFHTPGLHDYCRDLLGGYGYDVQTVRHPHYSPGSALWYQHGWLKAMFVA